MSLLVDGPRLDAARVATLRRLTSAVNGQGVWVGELVGSPLATAVAVSALSLAEQHVDDQPRAGMPGHDAWLSGVLIRGELTQLLMNSLRWLADRQNADGGWGDAAGGLSNLAATMAVRAALQLTGVPAKYTGLAERAEAYIDSRGGAQTLRHGEVADPALAAAIITNYALADLGSWRQAPAQPIEIYCLPRRWRERWLGVAPSFASTLYGALGAARFHHAKPRNPVTRLARRAALRPALAALAEMQPPSGGFLASTVATSFVVMSLASIGLGDKQVARRGVEFLLATARPDGSWPIEADHAVSNTARAVEVLDLVGCTGGADCLAGDHAAWHESTERAVDWLLARQQSEHAPGTRVDCGGWSASGWDGGLASASVTAAALTALATAYRKRSRRRQEEIFQSARSALEWLLALELDTGGWPEYRGDGGLDQPCGAETTAEVLRGLEACQRQLRLAVSDVPMARRVRAAISRGVGYLASQQRADGSWPAAWVGDARHATVGNSIYATAQVLTMFDELAMKNEDMAQRGAQWLAGVQDASGGWGAEARPAVKKPAAKPAAEDGGPGCSVEETGAAVAGLLPYRRFDRKIEQATDAGLAWLSDGAVGERLDEPSALWLSADGFWYAERLQPRLLAARALVAAHAEASSASAAEVHV